MENKNLTVEEMISFQDHAYKLSLFWFYVCMILFTTLILYVWAGVSQADESNIVAQVIAAEACKDGEIGMHAVANTIANRVRSRKQNPTQIVTARNQYFGYTNKNREKIYKGCKQIADKLAENIMNLNDITDGAEYFLLPGEKIRRWHGKKTVTVKSHTFYREARQ